MSLILTLECVSADDRPCVGGKAATLAKLINHGLSVPHGIVITTEAYQQFVASTDLRNRIAAELQRKRFEDMRWEELWDIALRIRNMFLTTQVPPVLGRQLAEQIDRLVGDRPVVVRSSAPAEDAAGSSFAGLHESYVNVRGTEAILDHVRKVWASLWSDAALLYRQEMQLDPSQSTMAVVVQTLRCGDRSGVALCQNPNDEAQGVVEAVHGLNQGMVDGTVEPDRWILDRETRHIVSHSAAERQSAVRAVPNGVQLTPLDATDSARPPLSTEEAQGVFKMAMDCESLFGRPQDVEWTIAGEDMVFLQSRPITTSRQDADGQRSWYLSLRRSFENLMALRNRIESQVIPGMIAEAERLAGIDVTPLDDRLLADDIEKRGRIRDHWKDVYWTDLIPFAHGVRLFGQVYNDTVRPSDPYEFVDLLRDAPLVSVERNRLMADLAQQVRSDPRLADSLRQGRLDCVDEAFRSALDEFLSEYDEMSSSTTVLERRRENLGGLLVEMAGRPANVPGDASGKRRDMVQAFLSHFPDDQKEQAVQLLDLGRASYRLRDNDNIYLERIQKQLDLAVDEGRRRLARRWDDSAKKAPAGEVVAALRDTSRRPRPAPVEQAASPSESDDMRIQARQIVGQPAGAGMAQGPARVIDNPDSLYVFQTGEVLVCDAVQPGMTFVVPLASAIVERRGGMLIHGAIIAREYGIPCVTGIPDATTLIRTGDHLDVDGFLGIVTVTPTGAIA